jgi:hypothetical protein
MKRMKIIMLRNKLTVKMAIKRRAKMMERKKKLMHLILLLQRGNLSIQKPKKDQNQGKH